MTDSAGAVDNSAVGDKSAVGERSVVEGGGLTVSVVIPARNDAAALDRCLAALGWQTVAPLEVVVVDNASTDATAAVARRHGARVVTETRVGIPMAAAAGYDAAGGEVIARLDADSVPGADWVGRITTVMADCRWDAVTGVGRFYELPRTGGAVAAVYLGAYYLLCHAALGHHALWGSSMAVRRSAWLDVRDGVHDDDAELHDDLDLAFALGPRCAIRLDRSLRVGVSARSLVGGAQLRRRFRRAFRTISVNSEVLPPWQRWAVRLRPERQAS
ncbi:glycosyltransferase [Georgenia sunbinii]|uniref:glycosyltransferase n=1 Tax=Georgenia sunbinii TaxID=3117728 RepID=UPI002F261D5D